MTPGLLLPAALAALGALLLPLLIHLARRSEQRPTPFAALRWLRREAKPRRRVRFEEWLLLLLRLLLVALLALWLARPVLHGAHPETAWVVAMPGVDPEQVHALAAERGVQARWLAPGFPQLGQAVPTAPLPVASLLRELDADLPPEVALLVAVPERLEGMDAQRPRLSRAVDWRVLPGAMPAAEADERAPPAVAVRHGDDDAPALRHLRAAIAAWHDADAPPDDALSIAPAAQPLEPGMRRLIWLSPGPLPGAVVAWVEAGGVALLDAAVETEHGAPPLAWWRDGDGMPLVEGAALGRGRVLRFTRPLLPAELPQLLEADFPQRLRALLDGPPPVPASVAAVDHAPVAGAAASTQPPRELRPWLALLIALVFLAERWLATSRRRDAHVPAGDTP